MKKSHILVLSLLVVLVIGGVVVWRVISNLDMIVQGLIEDVGSDVMQTPVKVSKVNLALTEGKAGITGLTIANPPGFSDPVIFGLNEIAVGIDLSTINKSPIVIDEILIRQPEVFYEMNADKKSNLDVLNENIKAASGGDAPEAPVEEQPAVASGEGVKLIIRKVRFDGGQISAKSALVPDRAVEAELPVFSLSNIGQDKGGATPEEIAQEITQQLVNQALKATGDLAKQWASEKVEEKLEEAEEQAKEKVQEKVGDSLDKLLNR